MTSTTAEGRISRRLASYRTRAAGDLPHYTKIWEAVRATCAAVACFDAALIGPYGEKFYDGALGTNNPIRSLWIEAQSVWSRAPLKDQLNCIISMGTGLPKFEAFGDYVHEIAKSLRAIAIDTEATAQQFHAEHSALADQHVYFRFNVARGLQKVGTSDITRVPAIVSATRSYVAMSGVQKELSMCGERLQQRGLCPAFIVP